MRWRFLESAPADGAANMALDEALMVRAARDGDAVFRVYSWSGPTLSLGRNQRAKGDYDLDAAATMGVAIVRRPTGGRALLHHREVTYSATLPAVDGDDGDEAYTFINDVLLGAINAMGVPATRATNPVIIPVGLRPCFDAPSVHEIVVNDKKLVGSAQWRRGGALLQHGSILVRDDQGMIPKLMKSPIFPPAAGTLGDVLGRDPTVPEASAAIRAALERLVGKPVESFVDDAVMAHAEQLRAHYADDTWTWRR